MILIEDLAAEIIAATAGKAWEKLERNHKVLKLLQKFNLDTLKDDFDSIYAHTLVKYGVERKPPELVTLFADDAVKQLFKRNLYDKKENKFKDVPDILSHLQKIGRPRLYLKADQYENQLNDFLGFFSEFTNTSRNPKELELFNKVNKLELQHIKMIEQQEELLEVQRKKSFDYQIEQYLIRLKNDFQKAYLNKNWYIDLNGEIRREKRFLEKSEKPGEKRELKKEDKYDTISYSPLDSFIHQWLNDDSQNFLVIIGEYGTGKTT
ncbi:MAG: hypothetical protein MUC94_09645, partial [bacterium]|nr:hypothetical protein [bacterium]